MLGPGAKHQIGLIFDEGPARQGQGRAQPRPGIGFILRGNQSC